VTLVAVPPFAWGELETPFFPGTVANTVLDANSEATAFVFQAPKTGTIDRVGFRTATVTTGDTVTVSLQAVDASTGNPTGTLFGTNTSGTQVISASDDNVWFEVTLTAGASVTRGDVLALVVALPSSGSTGNMQITRAQTPFLTQFPYGSNFTGGSWAKTTQGAGCGALRYSDTTWPYTLGMFPIASGNGPFGQSNSFSSSSTPDERGSKITMPFPCKVTGSWARASGTTAGDFTMKLYDASNTLLASKTFDGDYNPVAGGVVWYLFDTEVTLAAGDVVRITKLPTTTTATTIQDMTYPTGLASASPLGATHVHTFRTDAGSWTDVTDKSTLCGLILSALDNGA
jgi:hypothetical protein